MKRIISVSFVLIANLLLSACSGEADIPSVNEEPQNHTSVVPMNESVNIRAEGLSRPDGRVVVSGETNLPDKTELLISLTNEAVGFQAQDKIAVVGGKYSTDPLGPEMGLSSGKYLIEVLMPIPATQPESVQAVIGKEGQNLSGPLVEESSWGGKVVEYSTPYIVGSLKDIESAQEKYTELVSDVKNTISILLNSGYSMEQYRMSESHSDIRKCGELMRKNQAESKSVRSKSEDLSLKYFDLRVAAVDIYSCVSCSASAKEACFRVEESLAKSE